MPVLETIRARMGSVAPPPITAGSDELTAAWCAGEVEEFASGLVRRMVAALRGVQPEELREIVELFVATVLDDVAPLTIDRISTAAARLHELEAPASEAVVWGYPLTLLVASRYSEVFGGDPAFGGAVSLESFAHSASNAGLMSPPEALGLVDAAAEVASRIQDVTDLERVQIRIALARIELICRMDTASPELVSAAVAAVEAVLSREGGELGWLAAMGGADLLEKAGQAGAAMKLLERGQALPDLSEDLQQVLAARAALFAEKHGLRAGAATDSSFGREFARARERGQIPMRAFWGLMESLRGVTPDAYWQRAMRWIRLDHLTGDPLDAAIVDSESARGGRPDGALALARIRQRMQVDPESAFDEFDALCRQARAEPDEPIHMLLLILHAWLRAPEGVRRTSVARALSYHTEAVSLIVESLTRASVSRHARRSKRATLDAVITTLGMVCIAAIGETNDKPIARQGGRAYWELYRTAFLLPELELPADESTVREEMRGLMTARALDSMASGDSSVDLKPELDRLEEARLPHAALTPLLSAWGGRPPSTLDLEAPAMTVQSIAYGDSSSLLCLLRVPGRADRFFGVRAEGASQEHAEDGRVELRTALAEYDTWLVLPDGALAAEGVEQTLDYGVGDEPPAFRTIVGMGFRPPEPFQKPNSLLFVGEVAAFGRYQELDAVGDERERVRQVCAEHSTRYDELLGADATPEAFLESWLGGQYDVFHIACHGDGGVFEEMAHLILSAGAGGPLLIAGDIAAHPSPRPSTVILSACSASRAVRYRGTAIHGLAQAFLEGGATAVLAPRRPIADRHAAELAPAIVGAVLEGQPPHQALATARRALWDCDPKYSWGCYEFV